MFSWTPSEAQGPGIFELTVTVSDGSLSDSEEFTVEVFEVNKPAILAPIGNRAVEKGKTLTFTASASDGDVPANTLTFSLGPNPPLGASITSGGVFSWTPGEGQGAGNVLVTMRVSDGTSADEEILGDCGYRAAESTAGASALLCPVVVADTLDGYDFCCPCYASGHERSELEACARLRSSG